MTSLNSFLWLNTIRVSLCVRVHARAHHFILSSVNGHLRGFHTLAIVSNAAVKMM